VEEKFGDSSGQRPKRPVAKEEDLSGICERGGGQGGGGDLPSRRLGLETLHGVSASHTERCDTAWELQTLCISQCTANEWADRDRRTSRSAGGGKKGRGTPVRKRGGRGGAPVSTHLRGAAAPGRCEKAGN